MSSAVQHSSRNVPDYKEKVRNEKRDQERAKEAAEVKEWNERIRQEVSVNAPL